MDRRAAESARATFKTPGPTLTLGAPVHEGACLPEPIVGIPLAMMNRHGLIAGATGTGKTKSLQLIALSGTPEGASPDGATPSAATGGAGTGALIAGGVVAAFAVLGALFGRRR